ncbi:MAG: RNA polymerase sporulation sigma factor SigK [Clostridia bacterium]|nr:RNA polymerase sporulation sigma factor SigK [Clostridia bacterium]
MIIESFITFMNKIMLFSSYVDNVSCFPKPLSAEEEKECIEKYKAGDLGAKDKLISHNLRLVAHIVKKYSNSTKDADDLISVGAIGLIKAINTYSPQKGTQLSTYAARCIENEILMLFRVNKKHQGSISLDETLSVEKDGNDITLSDLVTDVEPDVMEQVETNILTEKLLELIKSSLSAREYKILSLRYGIGGTIPYTQREVAKKLGISRSYISRLEKKALLTVREKINEQKLFF